MNLTVETDREEDGRWIAEIPRIPGALAYGADRREAIARVEALALRVLAALLRIGWAIKRESGGGSHRVLSREGWPDYVFFLPRRRGDRPAHALAHREAHGA